MRVGRQLTFELKSLVPGSTPDLALDRVDTALPATRRALAGADVPAARSALRAQVSYLKVVRDTLKLETGDGQLDRLGGASARLVDRLERVDAAVPRASDSVGGARKLKAWAIAELAVPTAPVHPPPLRARLHPRATPRRPSTTPAPIMTSTLTPIPRRPRRSRRVPAPPALA